ncbi:pre-toxin TG domain-containing protein [Caldibacillus thermoamylovorans]|uniref:pre-toxin TG domain-containing protein n=1 Tax=Caldibacillus thermoamylovorans TaxID=35841 RepID=UPI002041EAFE|nr:polymorphic toxin type 28 domain-containing protein [Caldibacillus thermoamylovorans]MCM3479290.1 polymorphic toxin type 28 domain-containing protein [Caldibacillus thermoamylovorans]
MSEIKVKFDDLEEFADKIGKVERECDEALEALNWHFTSLLANFPGMLPDSIHALEYELRYLINEYKNKLDEAQRLIRLTAAEMEKDEQKMGNKVSEFLLELVGWNDAKRIVSEYDPVTGEKLSFGDRVLAGGFLALSLLPPAKAVGIAGKTLIKGVDARIPALAKTPGVLKKIRNVLDPKKVQQAFRSVYDQVVNAPIALTKVWFDTIKKKIGEIRLPQITQEAYAGIGAAERTVKDAFSDAKYLIQQVKNTKLNELNLHGVDGVSKGTNSLSRAQQRNLETLENIVNNHLTDKDFSGTLRDLQGNPVPKPGGGFWNHLQEMKDSYKGLVKIRKGLEGSLNNPNLDVETRKVLQEASDKTNKYIKKIEDLFEPFGGI